VAVSVIIERYYTEHASSGKPTDCRIKTTSDARTAKKTTYDTSECFGSETTKKLTKATVLRGHSCVQII
jgi:hypothetical protein